MISSIVPRPIGWLTTLPFELSTEEGGEKKLPDYSKTNLAPFSFFNAVSGQPPYVMVSIASRDGIHKKDTLRNIEDSGEFVVNVVDADLTELCNLSAKEFPADVSEPEKLGIELVPSVDVRPPRVKLSKVSMECKVFQITPLPDSEYTMVIGN